VILKVDYQVDHSAIHVERVTFVPIEFLSWDCLTLGALGWGQIQIANSNRVEVVPGNSRREWMLQLCDNLFEFYPREIGKTHDRIKHFEKVRKYWEGKGE